MAIATFDQFDRGVALRSPYISVYVDKMVGGLQSWVDAKGPTETLVPLTLNVGTNGKPSILKLSRGIRDADEARAGDRDLTFGDRIRLVAPYPNGQTRELFRGYVGQIGLNVSPNTNGKDTEGEGVSAYGPEILTEAIVEVDYHTATYEDDLIAAGPPAGAIPVVVGGTLTIESPVIFNPGRASNGENGNASPIDTDGETTFMHHGRTIRDLAAGTIVMQATEWTAYSAAKWIIARMRNDFESNEAYLVSTIDSLKTTLEGIPVSRVDVTGLTSAKALAKVLNPVGFGFSVTPGTIENILGEKEHFLDVYKLGGTKVVPGPFMGDRLDSVAMNASEGQRVQVLSINYNRAANNAFNDWTVIGDYKRVETVLLWDNSSGDNVGEDTLQAFWDVTSHSLDDFDDGGEINHQTVTGANRVLWDTRYNRDSPADSFLRHPFRSFAWNEDGELAPTIATIPPITDKYGDGDGNLIRRPRPFLNTLIYGAEGGKVKNRSVVEIGVYTDDDGQDTESWVPVGAFIWKDRGGFTLTAASLLKFYPYKDKKVSKTLEDAYGDVCLAQLIYNARYAATGTNKQARFRVQCSVQTDDRVVGTAVHQQQTAWPLKRRGVAFAPDRFRWSQVDPGEFRNQTGETRDDNSFADAYAQARREVSEDALGMGSIYLRGIDLVYSLGESIASTRGYEIDLTIDAGGDTKRSPTIVGITYDFREGDQKTELILDTTMSGRIR